MHPLQINRARPSRPRPLESSICTSIRQTNNRQNHCHTSNLGILHNLLTRHSATTVKITTHRPPCKSSQSCLSSHSSLLHPAWRSKERQSTATRIFRHDSSAVTTVTALGARTAAVGHVSSVAAAWTGLATRATTVTGTVATTQMQYARVNGASALKGRFAEGLLALRGWPTALNLTTCCVLGQDTSNLASMYCNERE